MLHSRLLTINQKSCFTQIKINSHCYSFLLNLVIYLYIVIYLFKVRVNLHKFTYPRNDSKFNILVFSLGEIAETLTVEILILPRAYLRIEPSEIYLNSPHRVSNFLKDFISLFVTLTYNS